MLEVEFSNATISNDSKSMNLKMDSLIFCTYNEQEKTKQKIFHFQISLTANNNDMCFDLNFSLLRNIPSSPNKPKIIGGGWIYRQLRIVNLTIFGAS
ncbi:hypothetical protein [Ureibacillus thermophilus]|uniref:Uncharacterized protein n=1 Tax=Ureibacillus thermophilus TaxID=367743 RepID=A0A4V1A349_9BACL|nr:hypothetical protein [Ureibacillus thermophilus]QBK26010.1 hypothetical protein DKZ56_09130 [Ureibacillus thermophilus]